MTGEPGGDGRLAFEVGKQYWQVSVASIVVGGRRDLIVEYDKFTCFGSVAGVTANTRREWVRQIIEWLQANEPADNRPEYDTRSGNDYDLPFTD